MSEFDPFEASLRKVEPAVRLVPVRHLRKVLHFLRDHGHTVPTNASRPLWASRAELAAADCLAPSALLGTQDPLLLLTTSNDRALDSRPMPEQLREYWRLLFQASVMAELARQLASGSLTASGCTERLGKFGAAAVREIRYVLEAEHLIAAEADDAACYCAFAASYLDRNAFAPDSVVDYFPSLPAAREVLAELSRDLDVAALLTRSWPASSADRILPHVPSPMAEAPAIPVRDGDALSARAMEAERKGNFVRAAILRTKASESATGEKRESIEAGAREALARLVRDFAGVLQWDDATQREWRHALAPVLARAAHGTWPPAARCLYELQKIPSDLAREVFAVDLVEPIRTLGRRPVKRPLPYARDVRLLLKVRAAHKQLLRSGLDEHALAKLDELFHGQMHAIELAIRNKLTPIIASSLTESGFRPANRVEEVARDKLIAELLDRVCERGYLRFGDLRDAVARNQLKMPDLSGPVEFLGGDSLLQADTRLAYDLDGIYRRGEFYLRWLQRGSSLFFGTSSGRWLFLYLIAPFLAAFLTLTFAIELQHIGGKIGAFASKVLAPKQVLKSPSEALSTVATGEKGILAWDEGGHLVWTEYHDYDWDDEGNMVWTDPAEHFERDDNGNPNFDPVAFVQVVKSLATSSASQPASGQHHESALPQWEPVFVLGIFLLLLFHVPPFRNAFLSVLTGLFSVLRSVLWDAPLRVVRSRLVVAIRYSAPVRFLARYLIAAAFATLAVVLLLWFFGASPYRLLRWGGFVLVVATIAFNTPWGWEMQERLAESLSDGWRTFRINLLPGIVATLLDWFRRLASWIERQLYGVDEWLRYRGGDSSGSLAFKAILGLFWFPFAYLARFAFYLLIEPQINPVKHFPVVTVSHKVILPLTPNLAEALSVSNATALWLLAGVPGVFGFIAWELLATWKLYSANRPERLKPVVIGSHGESMRGLLRPGFHSGTVPKVFRKLRKADHRGNRTATTRLHHDLQHAGEGVQRFLERELIPLLERNPFWGGLPIAVEGVRFGCQRTVVEFEGAARFAVAFENRDGRISARVEASLDGLAIPQREALVAALSGIFDMGAAEFVDHRERNPAGEALSRTNTWSEWVARWGEKR